MPKQLGIRAGERWAYKPTLRFGPLVEVEVLDPGDHYESRIVVRRVDTGETIRTGRPRLPAKWDEREGYLESHANFREGRPQPEPPLPPIVTQPARLSPVDIELIRETVREEVANSMRGVPRLAFTVTELAYAVGLSDQQIYNHLRRGDLTARYSGTKALIPVEEALRFVRDLPDENYGPLS
jgi:hypothetical protein